MKTNFFSDDRGATRHTNSINPELLMHKLKHNLHRLLTTIKWVIFSLLSGLVVGMVGIAFSVSLTYVTGLRLAHPRIIAFLPVGGVVIVALYRILHDEKDTGTNLVLSAIHSGNEIPVRMAPLIFISTLITHLCGGSAGREGAALQLGGSIGNALGRLFRFDQKDQHIMIMCGMSAAFSALFGTPMAAAIFSMEVVSVGIMHYSALVPCVIASLTAHQLALHFGLQPPVYVIEELPVFGAKSAVVISLLSILCALVSILFCVCLHYSEYLYKKWFQNPFVRAIVGGSIIVLLTFLVGNQDYNGTGVDVIHHCFDGTVASYAFLLKILFTALTLAAGFKGGEIVPSFFIGASFGCLFGSLIGFSPSLCAASGMISVFCGVTNSPITALLIGFELFGFDGMPYFLLSIAFSYMLSGYFGLYKSQKIVYSKFKTNYINKQTH
ncbi:MAG: chloride channel protein [Lachnospiraceae bacterium]|nr:chloride channel protein [Lachnospiraceae bacterium]